MIAGLSRKIRDQRVLDAMSQTPREQFVPLSLQEQAYEDKALPIGEGQTISQPLMVGLMLEAMETRDSDVVLDVGTGSGYQAAVLSRLVRKVVSVERIRVLARRARDVLTVLGHTNVQLHVSTNELGWHAEGPYDGVVVGAAAPVIPGRLFDQLKTGGRLVIPVGDLSEQWLTRVIRTETGSRTAHMGACRFVPLIGPGAWPGRGS